LATAQIGIIGGSGLYDFDGLQNVETIEVDTPYGPPSAPLVTGNVGGTSVAFLPRHGIGHTISPTKIPVRANIHALKSIGVTRVLSVSAMGSLKEQLRPLDYLVPDQLIDRTSARQNTFFDNGVVAHAGFADPFCAEFSAAVADALEEQGASVTRGGTCVIMEGPAFSTRAESNMYRSWGASAIGMTALPEAKLAREAELCYATMAAMTDYDVWRESEDDVTVETVIANLNRNVELARTAIKSLLHTDVANRHCGCGDSMANSIITSPDAIPENRRRELDVIAGRYLRA
jgi:5'-methylthioadenosine phosphorylase